MPSHLQGTPFAAFVAAAMTRDAAARPSATELLQHAWLQQHVRAVPELRRPTTLPAPAITKSLAAAHAALPARTLDIHVDAVVGRAAVPGGCAPGDLGSRTPSEWRLSGSKHGHSESSADLLADAQAAAALGADQDHNNAEGAPLWASVALLQMQRGAAGPPGMRRRADSAPIHGYEAMQLARHARRARRLPPLPPFPPSPPPPRKNGADEGAGRRSSSGSTEHTPITVLPPLRAAAAPQPLANIRPLALLGLRQPRKLSRLSRSSSSMARELAPGGGGASVDDVEASAGAGCQASSGGASCGEAGAPSPGQLRRIKSYIWSKKFSLGRSPAGASAPEARSAHGM
jgi:hypothetical protein